MKGNVAHEGSMKLSHYWRLGVMSVLSFLAMYVLMYAMVDRVPNVYSSLNQFYMAGLMTAPMVVLEIILMGGTYANKKLNGAIVALGIVALLVFWTLIRQQAAITDRQFLRSMIPHHAGAILMCEKSKAQDPQILELCKRIISSQRSEIAQMTSMLEDGQTRGN